MRKHLVPWSAAGLALLFAACTSPVGPAFSEGGSFGGTSVPIQEIEPQPDEDPHPHGQTDRDAPVEAPGEL